MNESQTHGTYLTFVHLSTHPNWNGQWSSHRFWSAEICAPGSTALLNASRWWEIENKRVLIALLLYYELLVINLYKWYSIPVHLHLLQLYFSISLFITKDWRNWDDKPDWCNHKLFAQNSRNYRQFFWDVMSTSYAPNKTIF